MTSIVESVFSLLLGIALAVFGLFHSISRYPGPAAFDLLANDAAALGAVLLFALGVIAVFSGVAVLVLSIRRLRLRWRYLRQISDRRSYADPRDSELAAGYR